MLRLNGKMLYDYDKNFCENLVKVYYLYDDRKYLVIHNGKAYEMTKEGSFLTWAIPESLVEDPISIKIQCLNQNTNHTEYVTNPLSVRRFADSPKNLENPVDFDKDYPIYLDMLDEGSLIQITERDIIIPKDFQAAVVQDSVSQLIGFKTNRYFDGIDRSQKAISFDYINGLKETGQSIAVNVYRTEKDLYFNWLLDSNVTLYKGDVNFTIKFTGDSESGQTYIWRTKTASFKIEDALVVDDSDIAERYPSIIEDLQINMVNNDEKLIAHNIDVNSHIDLREDIDGIRTSLNEMNATQERDFLTNPINLESEITGILHISNVDTTSLEYEIEDKIDTKIENALMVETSVGGTDIAQLKSDFDALIISYNTLRADVDTLMTP